MNFVTSKLKDVLPLSYGKARSAAVGYKRDQTLVFGSNGPFETTSKAITRGPTIIVGRKGAAGAVHYSPQPCWPTDTTYYSEGSEYADPRFFHYVLQGLRLGNLDRSTAIPSLSRDDYNEVEVRFPDSVHDQLLIVAHLDEQFSRLDAGVDALKRAQANVKRYRASVLKAACEGRLVPTEAALARQASTSNIPHPTYESGEQLLTRILEERRRTWTANGKYKEPAAPDTANLRDIPEGWKWSTVDQVSSTIVDCPHSTAKFSATGHPCIDTTCIVPGAVIRSKLRFVSEAIYRERVSRLVPSPGDIIYAREGTVGTAVRIPEDLAPCLGQRVMLMRPSVGIQSLYFQHCLNSDVIRRQFSASLAWSTVPHLNVADAKALRIPLPPLAEQERIVAEVERRLSVADALEATLTATLRRATRLRQAVLQRAFSPSAKSGGDTHG